MPEARSARRTDGSTVSAFIQSCYGGRVRTYDLGTALASLTRLSADEQHALIVWVLVNEEAISRMIEVAKKPYQHLAGVDPCLRGAEPSHPSADALRGGSFHGDFHETCLHRLAADGQLPVDEVLKTLYESEGVQGCPLVPTLGHPLQHIAVLLYPVSSRKDRVSRPARTMLAEARAQGGMTPLEEWYWKRGPGNAGIKSHSLFRTDEQAAAMIHRALCGEGGVRALKYLSISGEITVAMAAYLDGFDLTLRREGSPQGPHRFTTTPDTTTLLVTVLHARFGALHIHRGFPARRFAGEMIP